MYVRTINGTEYTIGPYADLSGADLYGVDLSRADLSGADLSGANLRYADLSGANLAPIRKAIWSVLDSYPNEVSGLRQKIIAGEIDGTMYEGNCACLRGTIAKLRGCSFEDLEPNPHSLEEQWFLAIQPGMAVDHPVVAITLSWIDEWLDGHS